MKRFFLMAVLLASVVSCSRRSSDDGSSGTRGGGDVCEVDYRSQLQTAFLWLSDGAGDVMTADEKARVAELKLEDLKKIDVTCTTDQLSIDGYRKTAITQSTAGGRFLTQVDSNAWFNSKAKARTALAVHELLVMLGIERTDDYHISFLVPGSSEFTWAQSVTCERRFSQGQDFGFDLRYSPSDARGLMYKGLISFSGSSPILLSENLDCFFANSEEITFSCYENGRLAVEMVKTNDGAEIRMYWRNLPAASVSLAEVQKRVRGLSPFPWVPSEPGIVAIPLGWESLAIDAPLEFGRCRLVEQD